MRNYIAIILALLYQLGISLGLTSDHTPTQKELGIPSSESYTIQQTVSRNPWDMVIVDDILYLGGGDYGDNTGPVDVLCYDLNNQEWSVSGTLNDEAIGKFIVNENRIYAPGFDSKGGTWDYGNYHWFENGDWHTNSALPDAVHNFDIAEFNKKLFFALGTGNAHSSPVKTSSDDGASFEDVIFYKDNVSIFENSDFDFLRVYDFFKIDDSLYCMLLSVKEGKAKSYDFYKYDNEAFHYISSSIDVGFNVKQLKQEPIAAKATYKNECFIAAGYLNKTKDFTSFQQLTLPYGELATDLIIDDDILFVLSSIKSETGYTVRIYAYVYNSFFFPVTSFESSNIPVSFAKYGNTFFVGLSHHGTDEDLSGMIYQIEVPQAKIDLIKDCT